MLAVLWSEPHWEKGQWELWWGRVAGSGHVAKKQRVDQRILTHPQGARQHGWLYIFKYTFVNLHVRVVVGNG